MRDEIALEAEATELLRTLIRNACVNTGEMDSGQEQRSVDALEDFFAGSGLSCERYTSSPGRSSLITRIEGRDPTAPTLLLMGHTDVVPPEAAPVRWREGRELAPTDRPRHARTRVTTVPHRQRPRDRRARRAAARRVSAEGAHPRHVAPLRGGARARSRSDRGADRSRSRLGDGFRARRPGAGARGPRVHAHHVLPERRARRREGGRGPGSDRDRGRHPRAARHRRGRAPRDADRGPRRRRRSRDDRDTSEPPAAWIDVVVRYAAGRRARACRREAHAPQPHRPQLYDRRHGRAVLSLRGRAVVRLRTPLPAYPAHRVSEDVPRPRRTGRHGKPAALDALVAGALLRLSRVRSVMATHRRVNVASGRQLEELAHYSRAVRVGDMVLQS